MNYGCLNITLNNVRLTKNKTVFTTVYQTRGSGFSRLPETPILSK